MKRLIWREDMGSSGERIFPDEWEDALPKRAGQKTEEIESKRLWEELD